MAVIVEVLNKQLKVMERHKFTQRTVQLGRAYDNDVILYDRHVCPHHAKLWQDEQGDWHLQDLASLNGSFLHPNQALSQATRLGSGQLCWLGEQALRIFDDQHQVAPAQPFNPLEQRLVRYGHWPVVLTLLLVLLAEELFKIWLSAPSQASGQWTRSLLNLPLMVLALAFWPAALALWAKLNQHEARFLPQLGLTYAGLAALAIWQLLMSIVNFSLDGAAGVVWLREAGHVLLFAMLLSANFYLALQFALWKKIALATGLSLLLSLQNFGIGVFVDASQQLMPRFDSSLLPGSFYLNSATSAEQFHQDSLALFEQTAAQRQQQP
jgi:hypothetical protein